MGELATDTMQEMVDGSELDQYLPPAHYLCGLNTGHTSSHAVWLLSKYGNSAVMGTSSTVDQGPPPALLPVTQMTSDNHTSASSSPCSASPTPQNHGVLAGDGSQTSNQSKRTGAGGYPSLSSSPTTMDGSAMSDIPQHQDPLSVLTNYGNYVMHQVPEEPLPLRYHELQPSPHVKSSTSSRIYQPSSSSSSPVPTSQTSPPIAAAATIPISTTTSNTTNNIPAHFHQGSGATTITPTSTTSPSYYYSGGQSQYLPSYQYLQQRGIFGNSDSWPNYA